MPSRTALLLSAAFVLAAGSSGHAAELTARQITKQLYDAASQQDFGGKDLRDLDLSGLDFKGARLEGANLFGADLSKANLSGVNLHAAQLDRVIIIGARFDGANLSQASVLRPTAFSTLES